MKNGLWVLFYFIRWRLPNRLIMMSTFCSNPLLSLGFKIMTLKTWQTQLSECISSISELCDYVGISRLNIETPFKIKVPKAFADRIQKNNPEDPLLLQVLTQTQELEITEGFCADPLQEKSFNPLPGLLHKYHGRVLVMLHGTCAIHCRYCFRRSFPYENNKPGLSGFKKIIDYLNQDPSIEEIIFSGGDPLINSDSMLSSLLSQLNTIPHLKRIRFHTRLPIVLPDRITDELITALKTTHCQLIMVIHSNAAEEVDHSVYLALQKLKPHMILLNQAVLLKNINDTKEKQIKLHKRLFECGVLPYYLHLLDKVEGIAHFEVSQEQAKKLMLEIQAELPGYLVPKLAQEVPKEKSKKVIL